MDIIPTWGYNHRTYVRHHKLKVHFALPCTRLARDLHEFRRGMILKLLLVLVLLTLVPVAGDVDALAI